MTEYIRKQDVIDFYNGMAQRNPNLSKGVHFSINDIIGNLHNIEGQEIKICCPAVCVKCEDAISRQEAIRVASGFCHWTNIPEELAKLPSVNTKPCEDAISRQAAIQAVRK